MPGRQIGASDGMATLKWHDGLRVGVESIDEDHRILVSLVGELFEAVDRDASRGRLEVIVGELTTCIQSHFAREEALMQEYHCVDDLHVAEHRSFSAQIPDLATRLLDAKSQILAQEFSFFLFDWLMNHIIGRDMDMARSLISNGLGTKRTPHRTKLTRVGAWLGSRLSLKKRIVSMAVLPIVGIVVLSLFFAADSFQTLKNAELLLALNENIGQISNLVHRLQVERGLSVGELSSASNQFELQLRQRRIVTDEAVATFLRHSTELEPLYRGRDPLRDNTEMTWKVSGLADIRSEVTAGKISVDEVIRRYTGMILEVMLLVDELESLHLPGALADTINALSSSLRLGEAAGVERALGVIAMNRGSFTQPHYLRLVALIEQQEAELRAFRFKAPTSALAKYGQLLGDETAKQAELYEKRAIDGQWTSQGVDIDGGDWFEAMTERVERLKAVTDHLVKNIMTMADQHRSVERQALLVMAVLLFLVFAVTIFFTLVFTASIAQPIRHFAKRMSALGKGNLAIGSVRGFSPGEFEEMAEAFEACRRALLRDHFQSYVRRRRLGAQIKHQGEVSAELRKIAATDPLTGSANRRGLEEVANKELARAKRYHRPLSMMMLDLDHFKRVNDNHGHDAGDKVLVAFSEACRRSVRSEDLVARMGGEEFAIMLPETDSTATRILAERLLDKVRGLKVAVEKEAIRITTSIGIAEFHEGDDIAAILRRADEALYNAKQNGRDQVAVST